MTDPQILQKRIRRNALLLGLLALAVYAAFYLVQLERMAG